MPLGSLHAGNASTGWSERCGALTTTHMLQVTAVEVCEDLICDSVRRLTNHMSFRRRVATRTLSPGDLVFINNSFVFRDVNTTKASLYLGFEFNEGADRPAVIVADGLRFNNDFKWMPGSARGGTKLQRVAEAIETQIAALGDVVFFLIGEIWDDEIVRVSLNHSAFGSVTWDPAAPEAARVEGNEIVVRRTDDEELVWRAVLDHFTANGQSEPEGLRDAVGVALDKLQDQARARVTIPTTTPPRNGITDAILAVLREQRDEYAEAVTACINSRESSEETSTRLNDVLRIAYNFSSDAAGFIRLIVSVCDVKPIVLWGTIAEHYALSEAFHSLPWSRSTNKASLKNYHQVIADARNSAFHNLFPFRKTLRVTLPDGALGTPELRIFSEHTKKKENQLTYQDKALVDILIEFTRARERRVALSFWQRNLDVMDATIQLFERTNEFLKVLLPFRAAQVQ